MSRGIAGVASLAVIVAGGLAGVAHAEEALAPLRAVAVQDAGRIKPLEVYARETVRIVTGKARWTGPDGKTREEALLTFLRWCANPEATAALPLLAVGHVGVRELLGLGPDAGPCLSFDAISRIEAFRTQVQAAMRKSQDKITLSPTENAIMELHGSFGRLGQVVRAHVPLVVAAPHDEVGSWYAPADVPLEETGPPADLRRGWDALLAAVRDGGDPAGPAATAAQACRALGAQHQPPVAELAREVHYYRANPFGWAMWGYFLGAAALLATLPLSGRAVGLLAGTPVLLGFAMHVYGFGLRIAISGRPPITNMYESVIWASIAVMGFALLLEAFHRVRLYALIGALVAWVGLAFAGQSSLDMGISTLVPVLRNNFWLTIHVPTIVSSYGAFALAMGLGHVAMGYAIFAPQRTEAIKRLSQYIYRAMQIGVLLLTAGTILGGVWASYSWGRFWGWDPKEVGAFVALLGYLAALHGRFAGWWRDFGLAVSAVICFQGVLWAWVGVNVLGVGLHAYGFSQGGLWTLSLIGAAELALVVGAGVWRAIHLAGAPRPATAELAPVVA